MFNVHPGEFYPVLTKEHVTMLTNTDHLTLRNRYIGPVVAGHEHYCGSCFVQVIPLIIFVPGSIAHFGHIDQLLATSN
jgi:hypothetical protein